MARKYFCKSCGETFTVSKEDEKLVEDGWCEQPQYCDECLAMQEEGPVDYEQPSDADPGL